MTTLLRSGLLLILLLSGCGWDGAPSRSNDFTPLTSIEITSLSRTIGAHTSTRLTATGNYSGRFTRDITNEVAWSSDAPTVAGFVTASAPNRVTGQTPGSANLTATVGKLSSTIKMTISSATVRNLTISPLTPSIAGGLSSQFYVRGDFTDSTTQDLTFDSDWVSSDPAVATVSRDGGSKGRALGLTPGTATITATFDGTSCSTLLTVTAPGLQSITVSPADPTILSLTPVGFRAMGNYSDGSTREITGQVIWSSSDSDIVTIGSNGAAKTTMPGTAVISATMESVSAGSTVKVTGGVLAGITLSLNNPRLVRETVAPMTATGSFSNGSTRGISGAVDWSMEPAVIATITGTGGNQVWLTPHLITEGSTVTARFGSISATANLMVIAPQLLSIAVSPTSMELTSGSSTRLTLSALFNDGTSQDVTASSDWTSGADGTASVENRELSLKGRVTGNAAGITTIRATYGGLSDTSVVTVRKRTLQDLTVSGVSSAGAGNQVQFTATARYTDGTNSDVTADTIWSIDKTNVATLANPINQPGLFLMVDGGMATITAVFGDKSKNVTITTRVP